MRPGRQAFTLVEALITLAMMGIMLMLVNVLIRDLQREGRRSRDLDRRLSAEQCIDRIGLALRSSQAVLEPASSSSSQLRLRSWNPRRNSDRLPLPPLPEGSPWEPTAANDLLEKRFRIQDGNLLCTQIEGSDSFQLRMLGEAERFEVEALPDSVYRLTIEWRDSRQNLQSVERLSRGVH